MPVTQNKWQVYSPAFSDCNVPPYRLTALGLLVV